MLVEGMTRTNAGSLPVGSPWGEGALAASTLSLSARLESRLPLIVMERPGIVKSPGWFGRNSKV